MAKTFTRIGKDIAMAVKEGGPNPETNSRLRAVIQNAKAANMPADNIKRAIERATGGDKAIEYEEITYEGYAPGGVALMCEVMTDNRNRTVSEVRHCFTKAGGNLGTSGSVAYLFTRTGVIVFEPGIDEDQLLEVALEAGAEDVREDGDNFEVITAPEDFDAVQAAIEAAGLATEAAEVKGEDRRKVLADWLASPWRLSGR